MSHNILEGEWFQIENEDEFRKILAYGKNSHKFTELTRQARVQRGVWCGAGKYMLCQYQERCPRNCCYDNVNELIPFSKVASIAVDKMQEYEEILAEARGA
jgi:hypothetical protein